MVTTNTLKSFSNLVDIGTTLGRNWYRGHSKTYGNLAPGIFREKYTNAMYEKFKPLQEQGIVENFRKYAPSVMSNLPKNKDYLSWLFWLQHYGMPTRLLDWSENILVAAFFAIISEPDEDGEIWTIYPDKLNKLSGCDGLALKNNKKVKFLSREAFHNNPDHLARKLKLDAKVDNPIALMPPNIFDRMSAQFSVFTIHPNPKNSGNKIEDLLTNKKAITRYIIPKGLKHEFELKLSNLGINYRTLFPDIEGLVKCFARDEKYFGWVQPEPPIF